MAVDSMWHCFLCNKLRHIHVYGVCIYRWRYCLKRHFITTMMKATGYYVSQSSSAENQKVNFIYLCMLGNFS